MELYALSGTPEGEDQKIKTSLQSFHVAPVTESIARRAGILARTTRTKKPDLLIAATAMELELALITKNMRDFKLIKGLDVRAEI